MFDAHSSAQADTAQQDLFPQHSEQGRPESGYFGVYQRGPQRFQAQIQINNKRVTLGIFGTPEEAALRYDQWVQKLRPQSDRVNFPEAQTNLVKRAARFGASKNHAPRKKRLVGNESKSADELNCVTALKQLVRMKRWLENLPQQQRELLANF